MPIGPRVARCSQLDPPFVHIFEALASYANSLTGSSKLHPPIIMKEDAGKDAKDDKKVVTIFPLGHHNIVNSVYIYMSWLFVSHDLERGLG